MRLSATAKQPLDYNRDSSDRIAVMEARNLGVTYRSRSEDIAAIDDLTLSLRAGEFVSILGPSGCGKSTLLRVASGLLRPSRGGMYFNGTEILGPNPNVGIVFQQPTLLPWETVLNNVRLPLQALRRDGAEGAERARDLLRLVGLEKFSSKFPFELSGGMQQRVGIARGLVHDPNVLLMDEPFAALDAMMREFMMEELQRIWMATSKSVLFITHSIQEAIFLSDRVIVLSARPARIIEELAIDLPRPRRLDTMADPKFIEYSKHLRGRLAQIVSFT